jgi:hypothetical protein
MAVVARVPRSRGGVSGVLLILIGAWGGLAPFVGPYFRFAYTPDKAWAYTSGRLWLSVVPGAAALLGGLLVTGAAHRAVGCFGAFIAALGGAWFIVGGPVIALAVKNGLITPGAPLTGALGSLSSTTRVFLEQFAFFTGIGVLILFFGALALGRFSVVGVKDAALAEQILSGVPTQGYPSAYGQGPGQDQGPDDTGYPTTTGPFPSQGGTQFPPEQPTESSEQYPTTSSEQQYPTASSEQQYPTASSDQQYPTTSSDQYPTTTSPFGQTPPSGTGRLRGPS